MQTEPSPLKEAGDGQVCDPHGLERKILLVEGHGWPQSRSADELSQMATAQVVKTSQDSPATHNAQTRRMLPACSGTEPECFQLAQELSLIRNLSSSGMNSQSTLAQSTPAASDVHPKSPSRSAASSHKSLTSPQPGDGGEEADVRQASSTRRHQPVLSRVPTARSSQTNARSVTVTCWDDDEKATNRSYRTNGSFQTHDSARGSDRAFERRESVLSHKPLKGLQLFEWATGNTSMAGSAAASNAPGSHGTHNNGSEHDAGPPSQPNLRSDTNTRKSLVTETSFGSATTAFESSGQTGVKGRASVGNPVLKGSKKYNMLLAVGCGVRAAMAHPTVAARDPASELSFKDYTFSVKVILIDT
jgi:hypothetical protein